MFTDNREDTLNQLKRFIYVNAPVGAARSLERLEEMNNYIHLEFRRDDVSCSLYIELDGFAATSVMDEQGNRWRQYALSAKPSWSSYGSVDVEHAARFVKLVGEVTEFASELLANFNYPICHLVETAEQIAERKRKAAEEKCRLDVTGLIRANVKGLRVGQERVVRLPEGAPDMLPIGLVTFCDGPRHYTTHVTATRTFCVMRTA